MNRAKKGRICRICEVKEKFVADMHVKGVHNR